MKIRQRWVVIILSSEENSRRQGLINSQRQILSLMSLKLLSFSFVCVCSSTVVAIKILSMFCNISHTTNIYTSFHGIDTERHTMTLNIRWANTVS